MIRSYTLSSLLAVLALPVVFGASNAFADNDTGTDTLNITVPISCSLSATGTSTHTATVVPGTYEDNNGDGIGLSTITTFCNDAGGYAIYAIGYSEDTYGNNSLVARNGDFGSYIATGTATSGNNSNWSMRVNKVTDTTTAYLPSNLTITNSFDSWHTVPDTYTKVANYTSATDAGTNAKGSKITTTYAAFISSTQPADTYEGQVKYALVHSASAPAKAVCNPEGTTIAAITCMQDISSTNKTSILSSMTLNKQYSLIDFRDMKSYYVAKLADGNVWMTQNLDHDISSTYDYNSTNTDVPYASGEVTLVDTRPTNDLTWDGDEYVIESYDPGDYCWDGIINKGAIDGLVNNTIPCTQNGNHYDKNGNHYHIGNYYNWAAAIAADEEMLEPFTGILDQDDTDADQSICPAGWTLPKGGPNFSGSGSFVYLVNQLSLTAGDNGNIQQDPAYFAYSGYRTNNSNAIVGGLGYWGWYWSSVIRDINGAYSLVFYDGNGESFWPATGYNGRENLDKGIPIRCVIR